MEFQGRPDSSASEAIDEPPLDGHIVGGHVFHLRERYDVGGIDFGDDVPGCVDVDASPETDRAVEFRSGRMDHEVGGYDDVL